MKRWEYMSLQFEDASELDDWGFAGWRLVSAHRAVKTRESFEQGEYAVEYWEGILMRERL